LVVWLRQQVLSMRVSRARNSLIHPLRTNTRAPNVRLAEAVIPKNVYAGAVREPGGRRYEARRIGMIEEIDGRSEAILAPQQPDRIEAQKPSGSRLKVSPPVVREPRLLVCILPLQPDRRARPRAGQRLELTPRLAPVLRGALA